MFIALKALRASLILCVLALLSACSGGDWRTDYPANVTAKEAAGWLVAKVDVRVPRTLTVTEQNSYAPNADIVWREEIGGDRYKQVDAIITEAAQRGSSKLRGSRRVILQIDMQTFHALSQRARSSLSSSGVHNIAFVARILDARTGTPLTQDAQIQADLVAFVGADAIAAEAKGQTQRVRIVSHVSKVIEGWLGGPDIRGSFSRRGR